MSYSHRDREQAEGDDQLSDVTFQAHFVALQTRKKQLANDISGLSDPTASEATAARQWLVCTALAALQRLAPFDPTGRVGPTSRQSSTHTAIAAQ